MSSKYQIFVSSTYQDLKAERDQVIKGILEIGHIPVGMEMFSAADEEQWKIIAKQIDQSDYYVVIVANRYGSVTDDGISYTEKEYDYALTQNIPTLCFIIKSDARWPLDKTDTDPKKDSSLRLFKEKVKKKNVSFWKNSEELYGKCIIALTKAFNNYPREGWIRAFEARNMQMSQAFTRLSESQKETTMKADGKVEFGWLRTEGDIVEVTNELIITRDPDKRTFENKTYEIGQQLHFAVVNGTSKNLEYPLCSIEFTSRFKHLHTENPATGIRTINSDLWGMSGQLTELRDTSLSRTEISSILARVLKQGQFVRFFVRFDFPGNEAEYNLRMKLKVEGKSEMTKDLILKVKTQ